MLRPRTLLSRRLSGLFTRFELLEGFRDGPERLPLVPVLLDDLGTCGRSERSTLRAVDEGLNLWDEDVLPFESLLPTEELFRLGVRGASELGRLLIVRPVVSPELDGLLVDGLDVRPLGCLMTRLWPCVRVPVLLLLFTVSFLRPIAPPRVPSGFPWLKLGSRCIRLPGVVGRELDRLRAVELRDDPF